MTAGKINSVETLDQVAEVISGLPNRKAQGEDSVPNKILKADGPPVYSLPVLLRNSWLCSVSFSLRQSGVWFAPGGQVVGLKTPCGSATVSRSMQFPGATLCGSCNALSGGNVWYVLLSVGGGTGISFVCGFCHVGVVGMALCDSAAMLAAGRSLFSDSPHLSPA